MSRAAGRLVQGLLLLTVFFTVEEAWMGACASGAPAPVYRRQADGTYTIFNPTTYAQNANLCWRVVRRLEEWTDYPEQGGRFIQSWPVQDVTP